MQPNDGQLLAKFLRNRDEHAFEELVKRHAGMVMAVSDPSNVHNIN
jgi:hypothetical protein